MQGTTSFKHLFLLKFILWLFIARVVCQLIQYISPIDYLPEFDQWHSGVLPYRHLIIMQLVIITWCIVIIRGVKMATITPSFSKAIFLLSFGILYFCLMLLRLIAGFTFADDASWLNHPLPTLFHILLSIFILCHGHYHWQYRVSNYVL